MLGKLQILSFWKYNISIQKCKYPVNKTCLYHRQGCTGLTEETHPVSLVVRLKNKTQH